MYSKGLNFVPACTVPSSESESESGIASRKGLRQARVGESDDEDLRRMRGCESDDDDPPSSLLLVKALLESSEDDSGTASQFCLEDDFTAED
jgi:hypothetical protein